MGSFRGRKAADLNVVEVGACSPAVHHLEAVDSGPAGDEAQEGAPGVGANQSPIGHRVMLAANNVKSAVNRVARGKQQQSTP